MNTYSFLDVVATIVGPGGSISIGSGAGVAEEGISIEFADDLDTMLIGADGKGQHGLSANRSGTITVRLLKTSPVNQQLMAMAEFQSASASTHGQNTLVVTDVSRNDVVTAKQVAFARRPSLQFAKDPGLNEWRFNAVAIFPVLGS